MARESTSPATKPGSATTKPASAATKPASATTKPASATTKPASATTKPASATTKPASATTKPASATTEPASAATESTSAATESTSAATESTSPTTNATTLNITSLTTETMTSTTSTTTTITSPPPPATTTSSPPPATTTTAPEIPCASYIIITFLTTVFVLGTLSLGFYYSKKIRNAKKIKRRNLTIINEKESLGYMWMKRIHASLEEKSETQTAEDLSEAVGQRPASPKVVTSPLQRVRKTSRPSTVIRLRVNEAKINVNEDTVDSGQVPPSAPKTETKTVKLKQVNKMSVTYANIVETTFENTTCDDNEVAMSDDRKYSNVAMSHDRDSNVAMSHDREYSNVAMSHDRKYSNVAMSHDRKYSNVVVASQSPRLDGEICDSHGDNQPSGLHGDELSCRDSPTESSCSIQISSNSSRTNSPTWSLDIRAPPSVDPPSQRLTKEKTLPMPPSQLPKQASGHFNAISSHGTSNTSRPASPTLSHLNSTPPSLPRKGHTRNAPSNLPGRKYYPEVNNLPEPPTEMPFKLTEDPPSKKPSSGANALPSPPDCLPLHHTTPSSTGKLSTLPSTFHQLKPLKNKKITPNSHKSRPSKSISSRTARKAQRLTFKNDLSSQNQRSVETKCLPSPPTEFPLALTQYPASKRKLFLT